MLSRLVKRLKSVFFARRLKGLSTEERFTEIYESGWWDDNGESVSGSGSTLANTQNLRSELPGLMTRLGITSMLDAPCGDFHWMQHVGFPQGFRYIGGDIVRGLIEKNTAAYATEAISFAQIDIIRDPTPEVDLFFCRDCLFHLSHDDIRAALRNIAAAPIRFAMITQMPNVPVNKDIPTGRHRPLNLCAAPFNLPEPIETIVDYVPPRIHKVMAVWTKEQLAEAVRRL